MQPKLLTRNFAILLLGQAFSLIGNYTLKFSLSMYVLEKTGSAGIFGAILAAATVPAILLSPLGGVLADRVSRRSLMVLLDSASGAVVLITFLLMGQRVGLAAIVALEITLGILGAFESPAVQACVPQMQSGSNLRKANALVNQIQALAALFTPFAGGLFYAVWGIRSVLAAVCGCFFCTALLECFLVLPAPARLKKRSVGHILREDLRQSLRFLRIEQPAVLWLLLLAALTNFFASGCIAVGLPYLVRTVWGFPASWYGAAESILGAAAILAGAVAGLLVERWKPANMYRLLAGFGLCLVPVAMVLPAGIPPRICYAVLVAAMGLEQLMCGVFSVMGLCIIQEHTPTELTGKIMAFVISISMCAQPLGQLFYGVVFDRGPAWLVLLVTGLLVTAAALGSRNFFAELDHPSSE